MPTSLPLEGPPQNENFRSQRAFTLLELLLVLAVLALLSSIALPRVGRMLAKAEHRAAADGLRAALSQLRLKAIQTGRAHSLRFIPGSAIFELRAEDADEIGQIDFHAGDFPAGEILDQSLVQARPEDSQFSQDFQSPQGGSEPLADWAGADTLSESLQDPGEMPQSSESTEGGQAEQRKLTGGMLLLSSLEEGQTQGGEFGQASIGEFNGMGNSMQEGELLDVSLSNHSTATQWSAPILFYPDGRATDSRLFVVAPSGYVIEITVVGISGKVHVGNRRRIPEDSSRQNLATNVQPSSTQE